MAADPNLTVGECLTAWLTGIARHRLRATTYVTYDSLVRRFLIPGLGARKLGTLTVRDVRTFLDRLPRVCQCCAQGWDAKRNPNHPVKARRPRCHGLPVEHQRYPRAGKLGQQLTFAGQARPYLPAPGARPYGTNW